MYRPREPGCHRPLELEAPAPAPLDYEQVKFRTGMCRPEKTLLGPGAEAGYDFPHGKAFPGRPNLWMALQILCRFHPKQGVEQSTVCDIDLRRFHLAFPEVLKPWRQLPQDEGCSQRVEVAVHRGDTHPKRAGQFRAVPELRMIMGHHGPKAAQRERRHPHAQLREVSFEKGLDKIFAPP